MSHDLRHRSRCRRRIQVELLESRALLSTGSAFSMRRSLLITPSSEYVNQQAGAFTVTLTLAKQQATGGYKAAALDQPETFDFIASIESNSPGSPAAVASPIFAPFSDSVTFPAGTSTETVTVPIISSVATTGETTISLSASPSLSPGTSTTFLDRQASVSGYDPVNWVDLYSSPDAVPLTITSVQLMTKGKLASAVVLSFNKPMVPATVENIHNYRILSRPMTVDHHSSFQFSFTDGPATYESDTTEYQSFPIAAATYDHSTNEVTLTLNRPTKASSLYEISGAYPVKGHEITDVDGQQLTNIAEGEPIVDRRVAAFAFAVRPALGSTPSPVGPLKSAFGSGSNWISG